MPVLDTIKAADKDLYKKAGIKNYSRTMKERIPLKNISFCISPGWIEDIETIIKNGSYSNRSQFIRHALKQLIDDELLMIYARTIIKSSK